MTIEQTLDSKLGVEESTKFLRKANITMAKWDSAKGRVEKGEHAKTLVALFEQYLLTKDEQKQYTEEMAAIMKENLNLWEMTR